MTLSGAITSGQSGPGSDGNEEVLNIGQIPSITEDSSSDCLVSYPGRSLVGVLPICWDTVGVFYNFSQLNNVDIVFTQSDHNLLKNVYLKSFKRNISEIAISVFNFLYGNVIQPKERIFQKQLFVI